MELVEAKYYVTWDGEIGNMIFGKVTPNQVLHWDIPSEEADRLLRIERWVPSSTETKVQNLLLDIQAWFGKSFGIDDPCDREWVYTGELLEGENLIELRGLISKLEGEDQAS